MTGQDGVAGHELVMVTNWLPVRGEPPCWRVAAASMVRPLRAAVAARGGAWVGALGDDDALAAGLLDGVWLEPVVLPERDIEDHYHGYCIETLTPLYVGGGQLPDFTRGWHEAYQTVNRRVARAAARIAAPGAAVWVHDYHLQLVPGYLRAARPDLRIGFFLHTPFPPVELVARHPMRGQLLDGLLGADLIGFQQTRSADNFLALVSDLRGLRHDGQTVQVDGRHISVRSFPASVDTAQIEAIAATPEVRTRAGKIRATVGYPGRVLLSVGRPEPADGVGRRLDAYAQLLAEGRLDPLDTVLIHLAACGDENGGSRDDHDAVDRQVAQINGVFARLGQPVVHYVRRPLDLPQLIAVYQAADVLLATPLHQGMTLAAKEFVAARAGDTGRLVLSEFTGAAADLPEADIVNPYDVDALKDAIHFAAQAAPQPHAAMRAMRQRLRRRDARIWADTFLATLATVARRNEAALLAGVRR